MISLNGLQEPLLNAGQETYSIFATVTENPGSTIIGASIIAAAGAFAMNQIAAKSPQDKKANLKERSQEVTPLKQSEVNSKDSNQISTGTAVCVIGLAIYIAACFIFPHVMIPFTLIILFIICMVFLQSIAVFSLNGVALALSSAIVWYLEL